MYWNDQGRRRVERARYDGSSREVLADGDDVYWPNQMALSSNKL